MAAAGRHGRRGDGFDWWILGARDMTDDERATFEAWEAIQ